MQFLSIFNLNIMHGRNRKSPIFPPAVNRKQIQNNLQKIAELITKYDPDIVTLQEVDRYSILSGRFNQFEYLGERLNYSYKFFSPSCSVAILGKKIFISGNAIFSKYPLENCESFGFNFSFPTERQGFIVANIKLPQGKKITMVSVHLVWIDWMRLSSELSRACQLNLVEKVILKRKNSAIIAGDMNCDFLGKENSLRIFANRLNLKLYDQENKKLNTNPSWDPKKRIDWIMCSKEVNFISQTIIPDIVSDHLAVFANLSIS